jgi:hypothetical protein
VSTGIDNGHQKPVSYLGVKVVGEEFGKKEDKEE